METRAPAVVAVVVTTGPAPHLEATLESLAAQGYDQFSVLVLANGDPEGVEAAVARVLPSAFVRVLERNGGFAAACNEVLSMVEGAAFYLFCHDDVVLAADALHRMVEEAYRSNAGIVTPKVVRPDDPSVLLHVGLSADRFGTTTERVEPGEVDHGQHDTARDVFVAPGGVTLVRADLFGVLGGFDPSIVAIGEDLDLCWRALVAGSRIVVAPDAVVSHHELLANGARELTASVEGHGASTLQSLARRHRLATMLTCYGRIYLLPTTAMLVAIEAGEVAVAAAGRDKERIGAIVGSWRWCIGRVRRLRARHHELSKVRAVDDHDIRRLQVAGASRLNTFGSRLVHEGMDVARGALVPASLARSAVDDELEPADHTVGFGAAFSDDESFDELDDLGRRGHGAKVRFLATFKTQVACVVAVVAVFCFGIRDLIGSRLPLIGRLAPLDSWWQTWTHFFATWSPSGLGTGAPSPPGYGVLGFVSTFVLGRMGILPRAALVLAIPVGAFGVWRLLKPIGSNRARLVGAVAYLCLPLGENLVAAGRIDVLIAVAVMPFLIRRLLAVAGTPGFAPAASAPDESLLGRAWRSTTLGRVVLLGALDALVTALDPAAGVAFLVAALGLAAGGALVRDRDAWRTFGAAVAASGVAAVALASLTIETVVSGASGLDVFGSPSGPWSLPGLGGLIRFAIGPLGTGALAWLLPIAALLALVVGRAERFAMASRFATAGVASLAAALVVARHLTGSLAPDVSTLLVPYAVAVAALIGTGVAAFEQDVASSRFGWRQVLSASAMVAIAVGVLPFIASTSSGRFDLPATGFDTQLSSLSAAPLGGDRILWLGDPRALPLASWTIAPGLAFATSTNGLPGGNDLFVSPSSAAAHVLSDDVVDAMQGETVHLGRLLAAAGIVAVVVVTATAPTLGGAQHPIPTPPPAGLVASLRTQADLAPLAGAGGVITFVNDDARSITSQRSAPLAAGTPAGSYGASIGWTPALSATARTGPVRAGVLAAALSPAGDFVATEGARTLVRSGAYGWAATWPVTEGTVTVTLDAPPLNGVLAGAELALWLCIAAAAIGLDRAGRFARMVRRGATTARHARSDGAP